MPNTNGQIDVHRLYAVLGDILSEKYGMDIKFKLTKKEPAPADPKEPVPA